MTEASFREAIIADPANETLRLAFADWLEEEGRPEAASRVRETARIRPEPRPYSELSWAVWNQSYMTNGEVCPQWLFDSLVSGEWYEFVKDSEYASRRWLTEAEGMRAILDAVLEDRDARPLLPSA